MTLLMGDVSGQQPKPPAEPSPVPLLPAETAWTIILPALPAAGGVLDPTRVYVPLEDTEIVALARETGATLWTTPLATSWPLLLLPDALGVITADAVLAVDRATGAARWRAPVAAPPIAPAVASNELLAIALDNRMLVALRTKDGGMKWSREIPDLAAPVNLTADARTVYVTTADGRLLAVAADSGELRWTVSLDGRLSPPAVAGNRVFVGSTRNAFSAISADRGEHAWHWGPEMIGGDVIGAAVDHDTVYFVGLDNMLRAVNRGNGNLRWKQPTPTRPIAPPLAFGGIVVVFGVAPTVATFNAKTGAPIGTYVIPTVAGASTAPIPKGVPLIDPVLRPFHVAMVAITADGRAVGARPTAMMFRDAPPAALPELPGRALQRERLPSVTTTP